MVSSTPPSCQAAHFPTFCILSALTFMLCFSINSWSSLSLDHISGGTATENRKEAICWRVGSVSPHPPAERAVNRTANMAAKYFYLQGFLLLLFNFISTAALEKRFSDFKRCADEECSSKFAIFIKTNSRNFKDASLHNSGCAASHKLRLISRPVANRYLRPGEHPLFVPSLCQWCRFENTTNVYRY